MCRTISGLLFGLLLASTLFPRLNAYAASFKLSVDSQKTCSAIEIKGAIKAGDYERFVAVLKQVVARAPLRRIYLNSEGGQVLTAIAITEVIRNTAPTVETIVQSRHTCNSACNIILSVGSAQNVSRYATLNIHQVFDEKTGKRDALLTREIGQYLAMNGMPPEVLSTMNNLSPKEILAITPSNAKRLGFGSFYFYSGAHPPATAQCSWRGITLKK